MAQERSTQPESIWNSRLFKAGLVMAVVGAAFGASELATLGVIAVGSAWAWNKGKNSAW